jgi:hypothetical protein
VPTLKDMADIAFALKVRTEQAEARLAEVEALHKSALADCVIAQTRLAEAERLLHEVIDLPLWDEGVGGGEVGNRIESFLRAANSADVCPKCGAADYNECPCSPDDQWAARAASTVTASPQTGAL